MAQRCRGSLSAFVRLVREGCRRTWKSLRTVSIAGELERGLAHEAVDTLVAREEMADPTRLMRDSRLCEGDGW